MKYYGISDRGIVRKENQDCFSFDEISSRGLLLVTVCDGMGGHAAGSLASRLANENFHDYLLSGLTTGTGGIEKPSRLLQEACNRANSEILRYSGMSEEYAGLGTTLVGGIIADEGISYLANIGDSRAYLISGKERSIEQITEDHSLVQAYVNSGLITREQARTHPRKNVITRALGGEAYVEADIFEFTLEEGEQILFCTDGLSNFVTDDEILSVCLKHTDPEECCRDLLARTYARGAGDNVTIALVVKT